MLPWKFLYGHPFFFKQVEEEKTITLSETSIRDRQVIFSIIEKFKETLLFYSKGTYLDFEKKQVFFEN